MLYPIELGVRLDFLTRNRFLQNRSVLATKPVAVESGRLLWISAASGGADKGPFRMVQEIQRV